MLTKKIFLRCHNRIKGSRRSGARRYEFERFDVVPLHFLSVKASQDGIAILW